MMQVVTSVTSLDGISFVKESLWYYHTVISTHYQ